MAIERTSLNRLKGYVRAALSLLLSPYLYILSAEPLANKVRQDSIVKGIKIFGNEVKLSQFAKIPPNLTLISDQNKSLNISWFHCPVKILGIQFSYDAVMIKQETTNLILARRFETPNQTGYVELKRPDNIPKSTDTWFYHN